MLLEEIIAIQQENWMRIIPRDVKRGGRESVIRGEGEKTGLEEIKNKTSITSIMSNSFEKLSMNVAGQKVLSLAICSP